MPDSVRVNQRYCSARCQRTAYHARRDRSTYFQSYNRQSEVRARNAARWAARADVRRRRRKHQVARRKLAIAARGTIGPPMLAGPCPWCGESTTCKNVGGAIGYCSERCRGKAKRDRRRALKAGVKLTPGRRHEVFERDNWTCHICEDPIPRGARVPDLDAGVVDHVIPLARGGEHGPGNWRAAHFYCNSVKRDLLTEAA